jgi:2-dehydro-3-deoxyphosphogluconate aldolase/(4S)-4-hydroxy-2-oxoglutarate aldolase
MINNSWEKVLAGERIVPVVTIDNPEQGCALASTLLEAGIRVIEVTFRTPVAAEAISKIVAGCPGMSVGAGTILEPEQLRRAVDAGAAFALSPGLNERVIEAAAKFSLPFIPGVMTPGEMLRGLSLGCPLQKFFPAESAGGAPFLKLLEGPFGHTPLRFVPTGGINADNMASYLALRAVAAVGGSWFVDRKAVATGDWGTIRTLASEAAELSSPRL